jgi:hypothetical protein
MRNSEHSIKSDPGAIVSVGNELPATVGALHNRIEECFGSRGWFLFQQLYHEAAGLHPRPKTAGSVNAVISSEAAPVNCDPIEPGLVEALPQMPSKVQRWLLTPPRDPPPWRRQETAGERAHREKLEDCGAWVGE